MNGASKHLLSGCGFVNVTTGVEVGLVADAGSAGAVRNDQRSRYAIRTT